MADFFSSHYFFPLAFTTIWARVFLTKMMITKWINWYMIWSEIYPNNCKHKNCSGKQSLVWTVVISVFRDYISFSSIFLKLIWITNLYWTELILYYKSHCTLNKNNLASSKFKYKFYFHPKPYSPKMNVINTLVWIHMDKKIYKHKIALSYYIHYSVTCFFIQWYGMYICIFFKLPGCNKCTISIVPLKCSISIQTCSIIFLHDMPINTSVIQDHDFTPQLYWDEGFPGSSAGKESACNVETWVQSLAWEIPWRKAWLPTLVFWLGEFHGLFHGVAKIQTHNCTTSTFFHFTEI